MDRRSYLELGQGWRRLASTGVGPFALSERLEAPDGRVVEWRSRLQRLRPGLLDRSRGSTWWAPGAVVWWIAVLFTIGSACFALGAMPGYVDLVGAQADATTFFIGSLFFTAAAFLEYLQVVNADRTPRVDDTALAGRSVEGATRPRRRLLSFEPHRLDWWAVAVQLLGTLLFNYSTFHALDLTLEPQGVNRVVWFPDWLGSACFLIASGAALLELGRGWFSWRPREFEWWVANLNMVGSLAFGVSAVASRIVVTNGEPRNQELTNLGTFVGALCFAAGAVLLLPERAAAPPPAEEPDPAAAR